MEKEKQFTISFTKDELYNILNTFDIYYGEENFNKEDALIYEKIEKVLEEVEN